MGQLVGTDSLHAVEVKTGEDGAVEEVHRVRFLLF